MMNDMSCGRGRICSIFPPLFNLIRSEFKAEWVSKILPWSRFQIVFWRADDASQSQAGLYITSTGGIPKYHVGCDSYSENETGRSSQLNETLRHSMSGVASCAPVTLECVWSQSGSWLRDRRSESTCWRWILSAQNCNMQGHLCYLGSSDWRTLHVTTAPATGLLSLQYSLWHIFRISKLRYWIICDLNRENPWPGEVCLFKFITKMSVTQITLDMTPSSRYSRLQKCCHSDHCWHASTWLGQGSWTLVITIRHLVLTTRLPRKTRHGV